MGHRLRRQDPAELDRPDHRGCELGETRIQLEHVNRIGHDAAPDRPSGTQDDVYCVDIEDSLGN